MDTVYQSIFWYMVRNPSASYQDIINYYTTIATVLYADVDIDSPHGDTFAAYLQKLSDGRISDFPAQLNHLPQMGMIDLCLDWWLNQQGFNAVDDARINKIIEGFNLILNYYDYETIPLR